MARTSSFATVNMSVAFDVGNLMTRSIAVGGALALVEPLVNSVADVFHEERLSGIERRTARDGEQSRFMPHVQAAPTS